MDNRPGFTKRLSVGEAFSESYRIFFQNMKTNQFFALFVYGLPSLVITIVWLAVFGLDAPEIDVTAITNAIMEGDYYSYGDILNQFDFGNQMPISIISFAVSLFIGPLVWGGIVSAATAVFRGTSREIPDCLKTASGKYKQLFVVNICSSLTMFGMIIALTMVATLVLVIIVLSIAFMPLIGIPLIIAFLVFFVFMCILAAMIPTMSYTVAINENIGGFSAVGRAIRIVLSRFWAHPFMVFLLSAVTGLVSSGVVWFVGRVSGSYAAGQIVSTILSAATLPVNIILSVVIYFAYRREREGYDPRNVGFTYFRNDNQGGPDYL